MVEPTAGVTHILVVDDEPDIVALVVYHLAKAGYRVSSAANGSDALAQISVDPPALVVLDVMLPDLSGFDVLRRIRADSAHPGIAVLMLTARGDEAHRIKGLSLGSDDYLTKPFSAEELVLRIAAILRRLAIDSNDEPPHTRIGPLSIDTAAHRVTVDGHEVELTPTEFKLLLLLAERKGRVQPRNFLLESVWQAAPDIQTRTVDMHIQRLRAKLGTAGEMIETVRGFGYRISAPASRRR